MTTVVVNLKRENYDVYIGRAGQGEDGYFGNPFRGLGRSEAICQFKRYFETRVKADAVYRERVLALKGKRLGCFCKPLACHGDVIAAWVNAQ